MTRQEYKYIGSQPNEAYEKTLPSISPPRLKDHYYEQIEDEAEGFFSEVGYHSAPQSPGDYAPSKNNIIEYIEEIPHLQQQQVFVTNEPLYNLKERVGGYEGGVIGGEYLQIDEVKESNEADIHRYSNERSSHDTAAVYPQEREVVFSGRRKKEREVLHRQHEREVVVNRSPEREK